ncbi:hypothetical protein FQN60_016881, partial [Etheostoma spectabile]
MSDIGDWFKSIPLITRYWFAASIVVPFIGKLGLVDFRNLMLFPELVLSRFHLWRPVTATLYFPITPNTGFLYMVNLYFLYHYSTRLETGAFDGRPADYVFMLFFNWICIVHCAMSGWLCASDPVSVYLCRAEKPNLGHMQHKQYSPAHISTLSFLSGLQITGMLMNMRLLMIPLIMSVLYVWAQFNKDTIVSFWFGTRFKAHYLPWVILVFNFIIGGSFVNELTGNLVGHLYFFLMFKYPMDLGGRSFLSTPEFLYRFFPNRRGGVSGFGVPPSRPAAPEQAGGGGGRGRYNWGQGFRLGAALELVWSGLVRLRSVTLWANLSVSRWTLSWSGSLECSAAAAVFSTASPTAPTATTVKFK